MNTMSAEKISIRYEVEDPGNKQADPHELDKGFSRIPNAIAKRPGREGAKTDGHK